MFAIQARHSLVIRGGTTLNQDSNDGIGKATANQKYINNTLHLAKTMNNKRLDELKEQVKYGIELYVDPIGQYLRTRPRQKPKEESNTTS